MERHLLRGFRHENKEKEKNMKTSVVIAAHRRMEKLPEIIKAWTDQCSDVWLCDCSKDGAPFDHSSFNYVHFSPDPGLKARYAIALLTDGDLVIRTDDDIMPKPGLIKDFENWYSKLGGNCIVGIHGRIFEGLDYYRDTVMYAGHMIPKPQRVDWLGVMICSPRKYLSMDLKGCLTQIDDVFWLNEKYPTIPKYVVPTNKYNNKMSESKDENRLCANKEARKIRREYYTRIYLENYKK